jgi:hypothetical protein
LATSYAVVVVHRGRLVAERYGGHDPRSGGTDPVGPDTTLLSWSMAKSIVLNWARSPGTDLAT